MKLICILLFTGMFLFSCENKNIQKEIIFHSDGNDVADIKLTIDKGHTFVMKMKIFPDLDDEKGKPTFEKFDGTWSKEGDFIHLNFKTKDIHLNYLFEPSDNKKETLEVINSTTVALREDAKEIFIWGVLCLRE